MKLFIRKLIKPRDVATRWEKQYYNINEKRWKSTISGDSENVYQAILAARNADEIDAAVGNPSWTQVFCEICNTGGLSEAVIAGDTAVCFECVKKMVVLIEAIE